VGVPTDERPQAGGWETKDHPGHRGGGGRFVRRVSTKKKDGMEIFAEGVVRRTCGPKEDEEFRSNGRAAQGKEKAQEGNLKKRKWKGGIEGKTRLKEKPADCRG